MTVVRPQIVRATRVPSRMAWWMPRGATPSPIACRAAPRFLSAREIALVERLPIDRTTVSTPSRRRWAP